MSELEGSPGGSVPPYLGPTVHVLRVSLRDVEPEVWRRVTVDSESPLSKLARVLERVMGWDGYHLHLFDVAGILFGAPDEDADDMINEKSAQVRHVLPKVDSALRFDYDFGDGWEHDVVVEAIEPSAEDTRRPVCVDGARACPPEDSGGPHGYMQLVSVLGDPNHPQHADATAWAPDGFDSAAFDLVAANRRLRGR